MTPIPGAQTKHEKGAGVIGAMPLFALVRLRLAAGKKKEEEREIRFPPPSQAAGDTGSEARLSKGMCIMQDPKKRIKLFFHSGSQRIAFVKLPLFGIYRRIKCI